ncbi:MAG: hypothetical protein RSD95_03795 [Clostridia bacterium]
MNIEDPFRYADADELLDKLISSWNAIAESKNCVTDIPEVSGAGGYYYGPDTEWKEVLNKMFELSDMIQDKYKEKTIKNRGYRD